MEKKAKQNLDPVEDRLAKEYAEAVGTNTPPASPTRTPAKRTRPTPIKPKTIEATPVRTLLSRETIGPRIVVREGETGIYITANKKEHIFEVPGETWGNRFSGVIVGISHGAVRFRPFGSKGGDNKPVMQTKTFLASAIQQGVLLQDRMSGDERTLDEWLQQKGTIAKADLHILVGETIYTLSFAGIQNKEGHPTSIHRYFDMLDSNNTDVMQIYTEFGFEAITTGERTTTVVTFNEGQPVSSKEQHAIAAAVDRVQEEHGWQGQPSV